MPKKVDGYILLEKIGKGNYGIVYKAEHQSKPGLFAVKAIPIEVVKTNPKLEECLINEVQVLAKVQNCQQIIKYYEMVRTKNNIYFVYQYCNGGNLYEYLSSHGPIQENQALKILRQILQAFKLLTKFNVMHRDLKPDNIFLHNKVAKLGDFGFCKALKAQQNMAKTMLGSPIYMAPEILKGQPYTIKADIWSLGVILYEMLYGFCPFQSNSIAMLINKITVTELEFPADKDISDRTKDLIRKMLNKDYVKRTNWIELFIVKINSEGYYEELVDRYKVERSPLKSIGRVLNEKAYSASKVKTQTDFMENYDEKGNKENIEKNFQSQKYMTLLSSSNKAIGHERGASRMRSEYKRPSIVQYLRLLAVNEQGKKRKTVTFQKVMRRYEQCQEVLGTMLQWMESRKKQTIGYAYLVLRKVYCEMRQLCTELLNSSEEFQVPLQILEEQINEIDRFIDLIREEVAKINISIPIQESSLITQIDQKILRFLQFQT